MSDEKPEVLQDVIYGAQIFDEWGNNIITEYSPFNFIKNIPLQNGVHTVDLGSNIDGTLMVTCELSAGSVENNIMPWAFEIIGNRYIKYEGKVSPHFASSGIFKSSEFRVYVRRD